MTVKDRQALVRAHAEKRLGGTLDIFENPLTVHASPAWRGVDADIWLARRGDRAEVYKHYHPDTSFYINSVAAIAAARAAGDANTGPRVLEAWPADGLFAMEHLGEGWRAGGLHDSVVAAIRKDVIAAKKSFQKGPALPVDGNIFADIRSAYAACIEYRSTLPGNIEAFLAFAAEAAQAMARLEIRRVPCHRDGNTANIMVGPANAIRLVDYDLAANADPYEDIGCHLMEMFEREPEARDGFAEWTGFFDEGLFQRAMVYGILDDLRWGLVALAMAASSPRTTLEFAKYGAWRLMRFEGMSQTSPAADRLRRMN